MMNALCFWKAKKGTKNPAFMDILDQFDFSKHLCFANMGKDRSQEDIFRQPFTTYFMFF